jgi:hypothetical protein
MLHNLVLMLNEYTELSLAEKREDCFDLYIHPNNYVYLFVGFD